MKRLIQAFYYSLDGFKAAYRDEPAFRQEIWACCVLVPLAFILDVDAISRALMLGSLLIVLMAELLNSAIEAVVDRHGTERHPLAKKAKDCGSAAVFLALVLVVICWISALL